MSIFYCFTIKVFGIWIGVLLSRQRANRRLNKFLSDWDLTAFVLHEIRYIGTNLLIRGFLLVEIEWNCAFVSDSD
jgi:hypothetical protein